MAPQLTVPPVSGSKIVSLGIHRPDRVVTTEEICASIDSTPDWVLSRSGIRERRFAGDDESVIDMATAAAERALEAGGIHPDQVGCVIVATSTYFSQTPAAAPIVAARLGVGGGAFDLSAGCAGFCYALGVASDIVRCGTERYVLVIGVEKLSDAIDLTDRSTAFIFGDGAGAVVVGASHEAEIGPVVWGSDGAQSDLIRQEPQLWTELRSNPDAPFPVITMSGQQVFRWASYAMAPVARVVLERAGLDIDDLDAFVPHQANLRIIEALARSLKLGDTVAVAHDIEGAGNTSAASVPLAMNAMLEAGEARPGDTALLLAFGAGLVYAGQVVRFPEHWTSETAVEELEPVLVADQP